MWDALFSALYDLQDYDMDHVSGAFTLRDYCLDVIGISDYNMDSTMYSHLLFMQTGVGIKDHNFLSTLPWRWRKGNHDSYLSSRHTCLI